MMLNTCMYILSECRQNIKLSSPCLLVNKMCTIQNYHSGAKKLKTYLKIVQHNIWGTVHKW